MSFTIPKETMSRVYPGYLTPRSASRISCGVGMSPRLARGPKTRKDDCVRHVLDARRVRDAWERLARRTGAAFSGPLSLAPGLLQAIDGYASHSLIDIVVGRTAFPRRAGHSSLAAARRPHAGGPRAGAQRDLLDGQPVGERARLAEQARLARAPAARRRTRLAARRRRSRGRRLTCPPRATRAPAPATPASSRRCARSSIG